MFCTLSVFSTDCLPLTWEPWELEVENTLQSVYSMSDHIFLHWYQDHTPLERFSVGLANQHEHICQRTGLGLWPKRLFHSPHNLLPFLSTWKGVINLALWIVVSSSRLESVFWHIWTQKVKEESRSVATGMWNRHFSVFLVDFGFILKN